MGSEQETSFNQWLEFMCELPTDTTALVHEFNVMREKFRRLWGELHAVRSERDELAKRVAALETALEETVIGLGTSRD